MRHTFAVVFTVMIVSLSPAAAQESQKPWSMKIHNNYGAEGFTAILAFDPGLTAITLFSHETGHPTHEVGRRALTPEETEILKNAIARFASADLKPFYDNPNVSDGFQMRVEFVAPDGRESSIQVANVEVPELNTLIATVAPLLPPTPTGKPAIVPYTRHLISVDVMAGPVATKELFEELAEMDRKLYDVVFNTCDLQALRGLVADDFEMYHDKSGMPAKTGSQFVMNIRDLCERRSYGGVDYPARRELVEGTLEVYPLNGYGAMQTGTHRFYREAGVEPVEVSRFTNVWRKDPDGWKLTRAMSYDHKLTE